MQHNVCIPFSLLCGRWRTLCGWASERSMRTLHANPPHIVDGRARCHTSYNMRARLPHSRFAREIHCAFAAPARRDFSGGHCLCIGHTHTHTLNRSTIAGSRQAWFVPDCISRSLRVCRREYSRRAHGRRAERERVGERRWRVEEFTWRMYSESTLGEYTLTEHTLPRTHSQNTLSQNTLAEHTVEEYTWRIHFLSLPADGRAACWRLCVRNCSPFSRSLLKCKQLVY